MENSNQFETIGDNEIVLMADPESSCQEFVSITNTDILRSVKIRKTIDEFGGTVYFVDSKNFRGGPYFGFAYSPENAERMA